MKVSVDLGDVDSLEVPAQKKEMMSVREEDGRTKVRINSSSLSILQECLRKANYQLRAGFVPEMESSATLFGSAVHKALEVFYSGDPARRSLPKYKDVEMLGFGNPVEAEGLVVDALRAFVEKAQPLAQLPDTNKRSIANGIWTLWHYFEAFIDDPYVALVRDGEPLVEKCVSFLLHKDNQLEIEYFGTIDLVMQHRETGQILVADHKTSSVVGNDFYNRLKPNHQYTGYLMGAREALGIEASGFLVNCIQVKPKPLTSRGSPPHFPRQITTRDDFDFYEFRKTVRWYVESFLKAEREDNWPLAHTNACAQYAGCTYLQVCSAPSRMREGILDAKFKRSNP